MQLELVPLGADATDPQPGDVILCHRKGFVSWCIRTGERIKYARGAKVSHAAVVSESTEDGTPMLVEALTRGVVRTPLSAYREIEYWIVRTRLGVVDQAQAMKFLESCVGDSYGFLTDFAIALRFLTPGRGLFFGTSGTRICSGLAAEMLVRGWAIFRNSPGSLSPAELFQWAEEESGK